MKVLEAGLTPQNYDKSLDKFVREFDPAEEIEATVAVHSGWQDEHAWAAYFKQGARRCLLLDTVDGMMPEEVLWTVVPAWVTFSPRLAKPRVFPGKLYFPDEATHIITAAWKQFEDLSAMPGFSDKSPICQAEMLKFSEGLCRLNHQSWHPQPTAEASEKSARIAEDAAVSRLRTVADGPNQWEMHRSSAATVGLSTPGSAMVGTESVPGSGSTGTCATSRRPPYT
jgi:hypothetical protein